MIQQRFTYVWWYLFCWYLSVTFPCTQEAISPRKDPIPANLLCQCCALQPFRKGAEQCEKREKKHKGKKILKACFRSTI